MNFRLQEISRKGQTYERKKAAPVDRLDGLTEQERQLLRIIRESADPAALLLFAIETAVNTVSGKKEAG